MKQLKKLLVFVLVAIPLIGFVGSELTSVVIKSNEAVAATSKKGSSAKLYGRLYTQYSNKKVDGGNGQTAIFDDEGMGRVGLKGKSSIGNGYAVNYKVEYALDIGDGTATSNSTNCSSKDCRSFALKQGWLGFLTPMGQFKFGSMESPYKYLAKHDILHDTLAQMRDARGISQGAMSHSSYWRGSAFYEIKSGDFRFAAIKGLTDSTNVASKNDYGIGAEIGNFGIQGLSLVYAMNHDDSADKENEKYTITYETKLADKQKVKVWYMHEDIELDTKLFDAGIGEVDWYGITYSTGPMKLMYSLSDSESDAAAEGDGQAYNIGMQYKLSKTSRVYAGYSDFDGDSGNNTSDYRTYIFGLRHDF